VTVSIGNVKTTLGREAADKVLVKLVGGEQA
jgi:hypothetical protein